MAQDSRLLAALSACRTKLSTFIRGRSERHDEAEDILQEISWKLLQVEQPVENVSAWLFRAARNEITDRSRKKRELSLFNAAGDEDFPEDEIAETLFGVAQTPEDEYLKTLLWGKSWTTPSRNCLLRSARYLKRPSCSASAIRIWPPKAATACRRCCRANIKRFCFCAPGCAASMTNSRPDLRDPIAKRPSGCVLYH